MGQETPRTEQPGDPRGGIFSRVPKPLPTHASQLDLTTQPLQPATAMPVVEPQASDASDPTPEELLTAANAPHYNPAPVPSPWIVLTPMDPVPSPVKRPKASKVFKWSAGLDLLCFLLFGVCVETFDPDAESFIAGAFALGFLLSVLTAAISGLMSLIARPTR